MVRRRRAVQGFLLTGSRIPIDVSGRLIEVGLVRTVSRVPNDVSSLGMWSKAARFAVLVTLWGLQWMYPLESPHLPSDDANSMLRESHASLMPWNGVCIMGFSRCLISNRRLANVFRKVVRNLSHLKLPFSYTKIKRMDVYRAQLQRQYNDEVAIVGEHRLKRE